MQFLNQENPVFFGCRHYSTLPQGRQVDLGLGCVCRLGQTFPKACSLYGLRAYGRLRGTLSDAEVDEELSGR
jgi:hypothetical protein